MLKGQGKMEDTESGCKRESNKGRGRFDLIPYEAMEALAKWYEDGAEKYGERNWEKGISVKDCINRMTRHSLKAANGWTDEDHLAAVMWNAAAAITMMKRRPDLNDHVWHDPDVPNNAVDNLIQKMYPDTSTEIDVLCNSINALSASARHRGNDYLAETLDRAQVLLNEFRSTTNKKDKRRWCGLFNKHCDMVEMDEKMRVDKCKGDCSSCNESSINQK